MTELPPARVGPYVRALRAALEALAPGEDQVSLARAAAHLEALDPVTSGELLAPAEVAASGMPSYAWLERARAEQVVARRSDPARDSSDAELTRAAGLDPALGARLRDRRALHRLLRGVELLASTELSVLTRAAGPTGARLGVVYDRLAPDGRWARLCAELELPADAPGFQRDPDGRVVAGEGLRHLFTRHSAVPLSALVARLADVTTGRVLRVSRGFVGPFWFPGVALPDGVPPELGAGLLLHLTVEVLGVDVAQEASLDPLPPPADPAPPGMRGFVGRRLAGAGPSFGAAERWVAGRAHPVVAFGQARPRRL